MPNDLKNLSIDEMKTLADEIRECIIKKVNTIGGHMAPNLGIVEATIALHYVFNSPVDKFVFDVSHQCYPHKILTGRKDKMNTIRKLDGIAGFPKTSESQTDCFNTGHSSTSISAGLGMAAAREITGEDYHVVSVIGDGSLTGGMAYEALNNASQINKNFIIY